MRSQSFLSKRGSTIIDATIVFPLLILIMTLIVFIMINLYAETVLTARLHLVILEEAGRLSDTSIFCEFENETGELYENGRYPIELIHEETIFNNRVCGSVSVEVIAKGIVKSSNQKTITAYNDVIDEEVFIRCSDIAKGVISGGVL